MKDTIQNIIEEAKNELKNLIDNPRTGLKDSSDTNKTRQAILAVVPEIVELDYEKGKEDAGDKSEPKNPNPKTYWLYKNHIYKIRPSCKFEDMFKNAVPVTITLLTNLSNK